MANALATATSPYLLQHAENPVDWLEWGPEVLERARALDRPVLVSIGYSACHWCHVMAHECFEDAAIAAAMNEALVCVKVDREERPDVDAVCMEACQRMTGQGGWPLNVFLTPAGEPFFAGTYFPPAPRGGMPAWPAIVAAVADAWAGRRDAVVEQAAQLAAAITASARPLPAGEPLDPTALSAAVEALLTGFDAAYGGWGGAPKFPPHGSLEFLLARAAGDGPPEAAAMAEATLAQMAIGGIFDQVGGGFHRYTVDGTWTVPHFEKMLYDNALLARAYLHAHQLGWSRDPAGWAEGGVGFRAICEGTLESCLSELRLPDGGFGSALDADSEGVEGRFYVWTFTELTEVLGDDPELLEAARGFFGATEGGNFEGANVLEGRGPVPVRLAELRARLLAARAGRVRPGFDDKRVTAWNALMVAALADAGAVLDREDYLTAARECARALLPSPGAEARLCRTGEVPAFLDDYAFLIEGLVALYEATWEPEWFAAAGRLADRMIERFGDAEHGGFFTTPAGHADLVVRRRDLEDTPIPSGSSAAAAGLLRLARLAGSNEYERWALSVLATHGPLAVRHPGALGHLLSALDFHLGGRAREVAVVGEGPDGPLAAVVRGRFRPHTVLAGIVDPAADATAPLPLLEHRGRVDGAAAAYVCEHFACQAPVTSAAALADQLGD